MEAFVYCWTDHKTEKLYVGSHKGSTDDGYVCSSKYMLEEYSKRPNDFTRQIVAECSWKEAISLETAILKSVNARMNEQFYNKHNGDGFIFEGWQKGQFSDEHRKNMSIAASKRKRSPEHLAALQEGRRRSKNSAEHNAIIKEKSKPFQKGHTPWNVGKPCSEETRRKISETKRKKKEGLVDGD